MPRCIPSSLCPANGAAGTHSTQTAIVAVLDANISNSRFYLGKDVHKMYSGQIALLSRLLYSLQRVQTTLPTYVLATGYRVSAVEEELHSSFGTRFIDIDSRVPEVVVPKWASKWARSSFSKIRALTLTHIAPQILLLDTDTIVFRNIDQIARVEAPAFVFGHKCFPRRELRAAVALVRTGSSEWDRAQSLMFDPRTAVYDDLGEGSVWRRMYAEARELPAGFAVLRSADLPAEDWQRISILHDANLMRKVSRKGFVDSGFASVIGEISKAAEEATKNIPHMLSLAQSPKHVKHKRGGRERRLRKKLLSQD